MAPSESASRSADREPLWQADENGAPLHGSSRFHATDRRVAVEFADPSQAARVVQLLARTHVIDPSAETIVTDIRGAQARRAAPTRVVLLVAPLPAPCQVAISLVLRGAVGCVLTSHDLAMLECALRRDGFDGALVSGQALSLASKGPRLSSRQAEVLDEMVSGRTNFEIACRLNLSDTTVKREVAELARIFDSKGRVATVRAALSLGFEAGWAQC